MADPNKPTFSFNSGANTSGGLFGSSTQPSQSNAAPGSLFGNVSQAGSSAQPAQNNAAAGSMFGNTSQNDAPTGSLFGNAAAKPSLFGGAQPASNSGSSLFGGATPPGPSLFGNNTAGEAAKTSASNALGFPSANNAGGMFGGKPAEKAAGVGGPGGLFGGKSADQAAGNNTAGSLFGGKPADQAAGNNTAGGLFGAKPADHAAGTGGTGSLFGAKPADQAAGTGGTGSLFGAKPADQAAGTGGSGSLFGAKLAEKAPAAKNVGFDFSTPNKSTESEASKPGLFGQTNSNATPQNKAPSSLFGNSTTPAGPPPNASSGSMFGQTGTEKSSLFKDASSKTPAPPLFNAKSDAPNLFGNLNKATDASKPAEKSVATPPLFSSSSTPANKSDTSKDPSTSLFGNKTTDAPSTSLFSNQDAAAKKPESNPFGAKTAPSQKDDKTADTASAEAPKTDTKPATNLASSTVGPAPPAQSRLKNKSMDDIISRWAADLAKYQKEFQAQAEKVATWDRMLIENSEKIQRLYGQTLEAERASVEVERQLSAVENDQAELESWLSHYENEVDQLIKAQGTMDSGANGPDKEREHTYQLAGRLSERLDEMGRDLTSMVEEINEASATLNHTSKKDDPLSQVVRVLNSHLTQLQQIDQGAAALTAKVQEAQRNSPSFASLNGDGFGNLRSAGRHPGLVGPNADAADGFYRSYSGRR